MESITLYYREGSSDKIYHATIEPKEGGFIVNFAFGRRGTTLNTGTKTQSPVPYEKAKGIYDKLVKEKMAKGYTPGEDGTPYQQTDKAALTTGIHCQLLNPIEAEEAEVFLADANYLLQEKHDGRRLLLHKKDGKIIGINRQGLAVGLPKTLVAAAEVCAFDFTIDGEAIGDTLYAFDVLAVGGTEVSGQGYAERLQHLGKLLASIAHPHIELVATAVQAKEKRELFNRLKSEGKEGVVFKHAGKPYVAGRPASRGPQLKHKFYESASFIVARINAKRSVSLLLNNDGTLVDAGNVTIPPNHDLPAPNAIVECRYLYAFPESGCIYQPTYLGKRDDLTAEDCTVDQLKYKPANG